MDEGDRMKIGGRAFQFASGGRYGMKEMPDALKLNDVMIRKSNEVP